MGIRCAVLFVESLDNSASRPSMRFASTCPAVPTVLVALEEESWQLSTLVLVTSDRTFTDEVVPRTHLSPVVAIEVHQVVHVKLIAHWTHLTTSRLLRCPGVRLNPIAQPIREVRDFIVLEDGVRFASLCQHAPRTDHILTVTLEVEQVTDLAVTDGNAARRLAIVHMQTSFARALDHQSVRTCGRFQLRCAVAVAGHRSPGCRCRQEWCMPRNPRCMQDSLRPRSRSSLAPTVPCLATFPACISSLQD